MYLERISESSLARGKIVAIGLLKTSSTGDKNYATCQNNCHDNNEKWDQLRRSDYQNNTYKIYFGLLDFDDGPRGVQEKV